MSAAVFPAFDFELELPAALIVIDMQPVGVSPGVGLVKSMESSSPGYTDYLVGRVRDEVVPAIGRLRQAFRSAEQDVVFMLFGSVVGDGSDVRTSTIRYRSEQRRKATGASVLTSRADPASDVIAELSPEPGDLVLSKTSMDSFVSTRLHEQLQQRGIRSVVVTGVYTDACVESTARNAAELGYRVFVASDGCCAWRPEFHEQSLANLARYFARVESAATLADLVERAAGPKS
ncbi:cysteine hydrolase family protein [Ramlibacter sp.]|uniref:cysteine hydrolase family protein n=1 Tax=Ramlibacter sp. TaxID=1917967 RepID=UPI002FC911AD